MELFRALGALAEPPSGETGRLAELLELGAAPTATEHSDTLLFELPPYASVYLGAEGMLGGEARDLAAGFWRALGETPPAEPDHLAVLLALYARLTELEHEADGPDPRAAAHRARHALLWEHLLSWLPVYLGRLAERGAPFYRRWGELLAATLAGEAEHCGPPARLPLPLRRAPPLADPRREGGEAFLASLLAPLRSGLILTRGDLHRAADRLQLGRRVGERSFVLKALLGQAPGPTLSWLAAEAESRQTPSIPGGGEIDRFWARRAAATGSLLRRLAAEAAAGDPPP